MSVSAVDFSRCPVCYADLLVHGSGFRCVRCDRRFELSSGPRILSAEVPTVPAIDPRAGGGGGRDGRRATKPTLNQLEDALDGRTKYGRASFVATPPERTRG